MFLNYHSTSALIGISLGLIILYLVRRNHLHTRYALPWLIAVVCIWILGIFPTLSDMISKLLGISYPPTLVFVGAIALIVIKLLLTDIDRSKTEVKIQRFIQRLAILEAHIVELQKKHKFL
jgi:hypothetical protein